MSESAQPKRDDMPRLGRAIHHFERAVIVALTLILAVLIADAALELAWLLVRELISPPVVLLGSEGPLELFGYVLLILIGLELLETVKAYLHRNVIHIEIVLEVALIAVARKVIVLDVTRYGASALLGMAGILLALALGLYLYRRSRAA